MKKVIILLFICIVYSCKEVQKPLTAQNIIDKAILTSGGALYKDHKVSFSFRGKKYVSDRSNDKQVLKRITLLDTLKITDVKSVNSFERYFNDSLVSVPDSMVNRYANSVNSVHYFSRLPFGLNDKAVKKELLGETTIKNKEYYKIKVTFSQENGGDDYDDTYIYWFNKKTFNPDYLAYEFHVDGGGIRFREAYNERYIENIRFVDYTNLKPKQKENSIYKVDSLYINDGLQLLSKIELDSIKVTPIN